MGFWEDSSPIVKGAIVVGILGLLYFGIGFFVGLPPFAPKCSYVTLEGRVLGSCPNGQTCEEHSGCPENSSCNDGECVQNDRGISR
jgi:hypothetical protein